MIDLDAISKVVGTKQTLKALKDKKVLKVILAEDTEAKMKKEITDACEQSQVEIRQIKTKRELGKAVGIDRSAAVVALLK